MILRRHFLLLTAVFAALWAGNAPAAERERASVFTIANVDVDVTARDAATARTLAMAEGQRRAYDILMNRILAPEDIGRAPVLESSILNSLVEGIELANERSSHVRYLATLTVRFDPAGMRNILKANGLAFTQTLAGPVVVVPYLTAAGADYLWLGENPWRQAWADHDLANRLVPYHLPTGDDTDRLLASPFEVANDDSAALTRLAARYDLDRVLVARLRLENDFVNGGYKGDVTLTGTADFPALNLPVTADAITAEALSPAVEAVAAALDAWWRGETMVRMDQGGALAAAVPLRSIADWTEVRRRLNRVNLIEGMDIDRLMPGEAKITLHYVGDLSQLRLALRQASLIMEDRPDGATLMLEEMTKVMPQPQVLPADEEPQPTAGGAGEPR